MKQTIEPTIEYQIKVNKCTTVSMLLASNGFSTYVSMNQISAYIVVHTYSIKEMWKVVDILKPWRHLEKSRNFEFHTSTDGRRFYTLDIDY